MGRELQTEWCFTVPDADQRRGRHVVALVGQQQHSGHLWHRLYVGVAATMYEGRQGYVPEDIARLEERGGMDPDTGVVVAWMDFITPPLMAETRDLPPLPMPERQKGDATPAKQPATLADLDMLDQMRNRGMTQAEAEARGLA